MTRNIYNLILREATLRHTGSPWGSFWSGIKRSFLFGDKENRTGLRLLNIQHDEYEFSSFAEWPLHRASVGGGTSGLRGGLTAGFAALRSYVGQLATSKPEESLTEATRQAVAHTNGSWGETGIPCQRNT